MVPGADSYSWPSSAAWREALAGGGGVLQDAGRATLKWATEKTLQYTCGGFRERLS